MCNHDKVKCVDSRKIGAVRRRRYKCLDCGHRFTTIEQRVNSVAGISTELMFYAQELERLKGQLNNQQRAVLSALIPTSRDI